MQNLKDKVRDWLRVTSCRLYPYGHRRVTSFHRGFTLMELVVVMAIIAILAGLSMAALRRARIKAHEAKAKSMIASLQIALSMYETDYGAYPQSAKGGADQVNGNSRNTGPGYYNLVKALSVTTGGGPYMEFKKDDLDESDPDRPVLLDPWGRAYVYVSRKYWAAPISSWMDVIYEQGPFHPDTANPENNTYNIYSLGVDGKTYKGQEQDASDWDHPELYNDVLDGDTASGVEGDANLKWLLDDINSWK